MNNCKNCKKELIGKFCQECGLPKEPKRIDRQYILDEISGVLNFDKGIFYTIRELSIRPGSTVNNFINGDRKRIVKPIFFLIICSLIYSIAQQFLNFEAGYIGHDIEDQSNTPFMVKVFEWFSSNYGYTNILIAIFIAFWIKIFFKKYNYNYYEIYILLCFVMGNSILMHTLLGIIESVVGLPIMQLGIFISLIYTTWAIGQFFDRKNKMNYLKGFLSYMFGILSCFIVLFAIAFGVQKMMQ